MVGAQMLFEIFSLTVLGRVLRGIEFAASISINLTAIGLA